MSKRSQCTLHSPIAVPGRSVSRSRMSHRATAPGVAPRSPSLGTSEISSFELNTARQMGRNTRRRNDSPMSLCLPASLSFENRGAAALQVPQGNQWQEIPIYRRGIQSPVRQAAVASPINAHHVSAWAASVESPEDGRYTDRLPEQLWAPSSATHAVAGARGSDDDADISDIESGDSDAYYSRLGRASMPSGRASSSLTHFDPDSGTSDSSDDESGMSVGERVQAYRAETAPRVAALLTENMDQAEASAEPAARRWVRRPVPRFTANRPFHEISQSGPDTSDDSSSPMRGVSPALSIERNIFRMD